MLGGGVFTKQNKALPGTYINFVSAAMPGGNDSFRGVVAMPLELDWGAEREIVKISKADFEKSDLRILGYPETAPQMLPFRELFRNAITVYAFRLNSGGVKASNDFAEARYSGSRGNAVKVVIQKNIEEESLFDVKTLVDAVVLDRQTVLHASELEDNAMLVFKKDAALAETAGTALTGGTDGTVTGEAYQTFLNAMEQHSVNIVGCPSKDESTVNLFIAYTKRMREEMGIRMQAVLYRASRADYEGIISVENKAEENEAGLVYWTAGAEAACDVNRSATNQRYDGEYTVNVSYTQSQLADGMKAGKLLLHQVGDEIRVLRDINTLVTYTDERNSDFADNQTIRVLDAIGNGVASIFAKDFMGKVPNDESGRVSLWNALLTFLKGLAAQRAIEPVNAEEVTVAAGETKRSVVFYAPVQPINCMDQLYMTVIVE